MRKRARMQSGQGSRCPPKRNGTERHTVQEAKGSENFPGGVRLRIRAAVISISTAGIQVLWPHSRKETALSALEECWGMAGSGLQPDLNRLRDSSDFRFIPATPRTSLMGSIM